MGDPKRRRGVVPVLTIRNLMNSCIGVGGFVGSLKPFEVKTLFTNVKDIESLHDSLTRLVDTGIVSWEISPLAEEEHHSTSVDAAEGATYKQVELLRDTVLSIHEPLITPSRSSSMPGLGADIIVNNALITMKFTVNTDAVYRIFRIPFEFVDNPVLHVHWTKSSDADESGKVVRWRVTYSVFDGETQDAADGSTTFEIEDIYDDSGTTSRIVYLTPNTSLVGFVPGWLVSVKIEAITPVGTPLASEPALFSMDLIYRSYVNRTQAI